MDLEREAFGDGAAGDSFFLSAWTSELVDGTCTWSASWRPCVGETWSVADVGLALLWDARAGEYGPSPTP